MVLRMAAAMKANSTRTKRVPRREGSAADRCRFLNRIYGTGTSLG